VAYHVCWSNSYVIMNKGTVWGRGGALGDMRGTSHSICQPTQGQLEMSLSPRLGRQVRQNVGGRGV
jgi:hypothetical protein